MIRFRAVVITLSILILGITLKPGAALAATPDTAMGAEQTQPMQPNAAIGSGAATPSAKMDSGATEQEKYEMAQKKKAMKKMNEQKAKSPTQNMGGAY
jgi:hypothetical protein